MALYDQEVARNKGTPNYKQQKIAVKLPNDQMIGNRNFGVRIDVVERGPVTKSQKGNKRKVGECVQWKAHGQCSKGDSCSRSHDVGLWKQGQRSETKRAIVFSRIKFEGHD